ncbi:MAG: hypothetical protein F6J98_38005, partial [Moorea sp. SIO4G2]|nr:hypothetical protein [Moorena sp. SIO4G2]
FWPRYANNLLTLNLLTFNKNNLKPANLGLLATLREQHTNLKPTNPKK